jgi:hypothetical protein
MKKIVQLVIDGFVSLRMQHARHRLLDQLDERTLRDIGMDLEANRARERTRLALRFGGY